MPISKFVSTYLNLLRWISASAVVLYHFQDRHFGPDWLTSHFPSNGNGYVMVFFVISGFVIAMTAESRTALEFALDRSIRIYIVALPILVITALFALLFPHVSDRFKSAVEQPFLTYFLNATFLCQSWSLNFSPYLDDPYWSLAYEVFYYLIFGAFIYVSHPFRWPIVAALCLLAGPKILILLPCWLAGVVAYRFRNASTGWLGGWSGAVIIPALIVVLLVSGIKNWAHDVSHEVEYFHNSGSEAFLRSWIVSAAVAIHLWGVCQISSAFPISWLIPFQSVGRELAGMSYSLYLLHLPVLYMLAYWWDDNQSIGVILLGLPAAFFLSLVFSRMTEARRHNLLKWVTTRLR